MQDFAINFERSLSWFKVFPPRSINYGVELIYVLIIPIHSLKLIIDVILYFILFLKARYSRVFFLYLGSFNHIFINHVGINTSSIKMSFDIQSSMKIFFET